MKDTIHTIRRSAHHFFSGTLLSRLTGMLRDMSMAYVFGTQPSIAAFMVAFRFAHLLRRLFGEGALQSAFIPEFEALRQQHELRAFTFFRDLSFALSLCLICLILTGSSILAACLWWGYLAPDGKEIIFLTLLMLPSLLFICLFGLNASFLQCEKSYFIPSVAPVAFNGIWIASVFYLRKMPAEQAMPWLACGVVIACFAQWILTVPKTWKNLRRFSLSSLSLRSADLRLLINPLVLGILGVAASQINNAIDSLYARFAEAEGPALLWYAIRIQQLPLALFGIAIAGAVLPPLSRARKAQRWEEYRHFLHDALSRTWMFMLPLTAALFVMGDTAVSFLYGRGDFSPQSIIQTTYCLWAYDVGLIPSAFVLILAPACYAQSNYKLPAAASFLTMLLNLTLNTFFILQLGWGAVSVALATSLSAWVNFFVLAWNLSKQGTSLFSWSHFQKGMAMGIATGITSWGTYQLRTFVHHPFFSDPLLNSFSIQNQLLILVYQTLTFAGILIIFFYIFQLLFFFLTKKYNNKQLNVNN